MREWRMQDMRAQAVAALVLIALCLAALPARAQTVGIIRDAEIESMIRSLAAPLLKVASVRTNPRIYLVADRRFNAFVTEDGAIYMNYGTILNAEAPSELKAILAHEIGHLAGGHLARLRERTEINGRMQAVAMLLGVGATAAAAASGSNREVGEMAAAFILASQSAGFNSLMAYRRSEESAADAAGLKFLEAAGLSGKGMVDVMERLTRDQVAQAGANPYLSTHPEAADRLNQVRELARSGRNWGRDDSLAEKQALRFAQAKLAGFLDNQQAVLNRYPNSDKSAPARYARIIAAYKGGAAIAALTQMPALAASAPNNPYFQELLGQMYFETGKAREAVGPLGRAMRLAPEETLVRVMYGHALLEAGDLSEAAIQLTRSAREDPDSPRSYTLLARAYDQMGRAGDATLAAAEAAMVRGDKGTALGLARQAQHQLQPATPAWLRAEDIILSLEG